VVATSLRPKSGFAIAGISVEFDRRVRGVVAKSNFSLGD
jgi:hypothetical protein